MLRELPGELLVLATSVADFILFLLALEKSSTDRLKAYISSLQCSLPPEILRLFNDDAEAEELRTVNLKRGLPAPTTHGIEGEGAARPSSRAVRGAVVPAL